MARMFTKQLPTDVQKQIQNNAGLIMKEFEPTTFNGTIDRSKILWATDGGINITSVPTYHDNAEGIDNATMNLKELKILDSWAHNISMTVKSVTKDTLMTMLGAADGSTNTITPRSYVQDSDFQTFWFVCDYGDGGYIAVKVDNALNQGGFSLQTSNNDKGAFTVNLTAHGTITAPDTSPVTYYVYDATSNT